MNSIQAQLRFLQMEAVRLTNEKFNRDEHVRFLEEENKSIESETREEFRMKLDLMEHERNLAISKAERETHRTDVQSHRSDHALS